MKNEYQKPRDPTVAIMNMKIAKAAKNLVIPVAEKPPTNSEKFDNYINKKKEKAITSKDYRQIAIERAMGKKKSIDRKELKEENTSKIRKRMEQDKGEKLAVILQNKYDEKIQKASNGGKRIPKAQTNKIAEEVMNKDKLDKLRWSTLNQANNYTSALQKDKRSRKVSDNIRRMVNLANDGEGYTNSTKILKIDGATRELMAPRGLSRNPKKVKEEVIEIRKPTVRQGKIKKKDNK